MLWREAFKDDLEISGSMNVCMQVRPIKTIFPLNMPSESQARRTYPVVPVTHRSVEAEVGREAPGELGVGVRSWDYIGFRV